VSVREKLRFDWPTMTDEEYLKAAEMQLWLSAFAANNPRAPAHKHADEAYDEAQRREKPWLYQRAWNASYRSAGYEPSEREIELAKEPAQ